MPAEVFVVGILMFVSIICGLIGYFAGRRTLEAEAIGSLMVIHEDEGSPVVYLSVKAHPDTWKHNEFVLMHVTQIGGNKSDAITVEDNYQKGEKDGD